jgi:hypothetical protein
MIAHLEDFAMAAWLAGEEDAAALAHLEACTPCRKEAVDLRERLKKFSEAVHAAGDAREIRWVQPAEAAAVQRISPGVVLAWTVRGALAACVLVLALLMNAPRPSAPAPSSDAADNALLQAIQSDLNQRAPQALAPAELLLAQMTVSENSNGELEQQGGKQ